MHISASHFLRSVQSLCSHVKDKPTKFANFISNLVGVKNINAHPSANKTETQHVMQHHEIPKCYGRKSGMVAVQELNILKANERLSNFGYISKQEVKNISANVNQFTFVKSPDVSKLSR